MNPYRLFFLSSVLMLAVSFPCFADQVQGLIESIDSSNNSILIKDPLNGEEKSLFVHPKVIAGIKKGNIVKAVFQSGSDKADTLEVLLPIK